MDPNIQSILIGLLTNGLTSFIAQFGQRDSKLFLGEKLFNKMQWEEKALQPIIKKAIQSTAAEIVWKEKPIVEIACLFLNSPEAETIVRQIYATTLLHDPGKNFLNMIQKEFLSSFYLYTTSYPEYKDLKEEELANASNFLMHTLIEGCEQAFNVAIDNGILSAHEAKSAFRHQALLDEIASVKENLSFLTTPQKPNVAEILDFERTYKRLVREQSKYITPPNFDKVRNVHINEIYVLPNLICTDKRKSEAQDQDIQESEKELVKPYRSVFLDTLRIVLLGNPGGGKSTFAKKLCYDLTEYNSERFLAGRKELIPILVTLRDYGIEKKTHNLSILDFVKIKTKSDHQIEQPTGAFEYLLLNGRAMIIFDGLDELLETNYRQEISRSVNSFCALYPSVPVLVTSREVGYEQAPLDKEKFEIFRLAAFDIDQTKDYAKKWFYTLDDLSVEQREQKASSFLLESNNIPDLRSNPLMLALLCNIYREENYIPKHRPDVYEKCATLLFERWDKSRGIESILPFESQIRPAMSYLAYWIYANEDLRGGVTEDKLIEKTKEYLRQKLYEDPDEAAEAAREFIEFCRGRAWVFTNAGSTKDEELYKFTHQTFLEYFTAVYLFRTHPTPERLIKALLSRISKREWDIVAQLAFQIQNKHIENAGDELLSLLIEQVYSTKGEEKYNLLSFLVRCLEFIVCNPKTIQSIVNACINLYIDNIPNKGVHRFKSNLENTFAALLITAKENQKATAFYIEKIIIEKVESNKETDAMLAFQIGLSLSSYFMTNYRSSRANGLIKSGIALNSEYTRAFWENISLSISDKCINQLKTLCKRSLVLSLLASTYGKASLIDIMKWHGIEGIFCEGRYPLRPGTRRTSEAEIILRTLTLPNRSTKIKETIKKLEELASYIISRPLPWISTSTHITNLNVLLYRQRPSEGIGKILEKSNLAMFGLVIIFAIYWELGTRQNIIEQILDKKLETSPWGQIFDILSSRGKPSLSNKAKTVMNNLSFTTEQQSFLWKWISEETNLIGNPISGNDVQNQINLMEE